MNKWLNRWQQWRARWQQWRARWQRRWLDRRIPPARQITLGPRTLFILPTRMGLLYLLVLLAIYLLGTNYQNNLVLLVAYCLGSLFMAAMWLTHRNLLGLELLGGTLVLGEAGSQLPIRILVQSPRPVQALHFSLNEGTLWLAQADALPSTVILPVSGSRRGLLPLGRLRVESRYPPRSVSLLDATGLATGGLARPQTGVRGAKRGTCDRKRRASGPTRSSPSR